MAKHRAPRYTRTRHALAVVPAAAGATVIGLSLLSAPAQAAGTQHSSSAAAGPACATALVARDTPAVARITNSAGPVQPQTQAAANVVVSDVPGVSGITLYGTRASAIDPTGHPAGLALDYMVGATRIPLGDAVARYHVAHWKELCVKYVIWQQRILTSPKGSWKPMADRGSPTANHLDHVHVSYRG
jgi:hypothetical protein